MKEQLLHYIWQNKLFNTKDLKTTSGSNLQVIDFGKYNKDGGPDFWNAKIRIDDIILIGNIELHINASDWRLHKHQFDKKYDNVILHVVYFNDASTAMPTLELNGRISAILLEKYEAMMLSRDELICKNMIGTVDQFTIEKWKERLVIERLERKSKDILFNLSVNNNDWEQTVYQLCGKYFGAPVNKEPFELLTQLLHHKIIMKHTASVFQLEALLFGAAGFLDKEYKDEYLRELKKEYQYLKHKYRISQLQEHQWQFLRMRPVSFPTIRIAWFAQLMQKMPLFSKMITKEEPEQLLHGIEVSHYWKTHYVFEKEGKYNSKYLGDEFRNLLCINLLAPLLYAYGRAGNGDKYTDKAFDILCKTRSEQNAKTRIFEAAKWEQPDAFHSQATIELYDQYCCRKRCLECGIGHKILRS